MEEVTELQPVPDAHVPVMKFKFDGISVDLLYASISLLVVPEVSSRVFFSLFFMDSLQNQTICKSVDHMVNFFLVNEGYFFPL